MGQLKKGAIISYITVIFNIISGIFFTPFLISKVGSGYYGTYTLVNTFLSYFLIDFGLGSAVGKYISQYRVEHRREDEEKFLSVVMKLFLLIAAIIGILFFVLYFFIENFFQGLNGNEVLVLKEMYIISGFSSVFLFVFIPLDGILTAYEEFVILKGLEFFRKVMIIILSLIVLSFRHSVVALVTINAIVGFGITATKLFFVIKKINYKIQIAYFDIEILKKVASFSLWMLLVNVAQRFIIPIAPTILGRFSNAQEISIFSIATIINGYIYTIASCLNEIFMPVLTRMIWQNSYREINCLFCRLGRLQLFVIGTVMSTFVVFGKEFIVVWVGVKFLKAYEVILLISMSNIIVFTQEVANIILMVEEKNKYRGICYLVGASISVIISCVLVPEYGSIGTGIGIAICLWGFHVVAMNYVYVKCTKLEIKKFFVQCHCKILPIFVAFTILTMVVNQLFQSSNLIIVIMKILLYIVILLGVLWVFIMNSEERKLVNDICKRTKNNT